MHPPEGILIELDVKSCGGFMVLVLLATRKDGKNETKVVLWTRKVHRDTCALFIYRVYPAMLIVDTKRKGRAMLHAED
jgi:hypothetical protein